MSTLEIRGQYVDLVVIVHGQYSWSSTHRCDRAHISRQYQFPFPSNLDLSDCVLDSSAAMSECQPSNTVANVGLAFGLVTAAGLSTTIGAALAFVMPKSRGGKNLFLAASLAIAAGVMLFVSFAEIFADKAVNAFIACLGESRAKFV